VTLEEVAFSVEKTVKLPRAETCTSCRGTGAANGGLSDCDACHGTGQIVKEQRSDYSVFRQITGCSACRGSGKIIKEACKDCEGRSVIETTEEIQVTIPAGAYSGYSIRLDGKGEKDGGVPGDLYVVLNVEKHPLFERHDDDIYVQQDISLTIAALGGEIQVPSLTGDLTLDIPESTQTGSVFRITGKGIAHLNGAGRGDEYVIVKVVTPVDLSTKERELLRQFEKLRQQKEEKSDQP
jgi:molecular chaperone DnaJ